MSSPATSSQAADAGVATQDQAADAGVATKDFQKMHAFVKRRYRDMDVHILCECSDTNPCPFNSSKTSCDCALVAACNYLTLQSPSIRFARVEPKPDGDVHSVSQQALKNFMCRRLFEFTQLLKSVPVTDPKGKEEIDSKLQEITTAINCVPLLLTGPNLDPHLIRREELQFARNNDYILLHHLGIRVVHGWLVDPQDTICYDTIGDSSHSGVMKKISEHSSKKFKRKCRAVNDFLESSKTQLTYYGLKCLREELKEGDHAVLYKNGHYRVIVKHFGVLLTLETNIDVLTHHVGAMWRTLDEEVDGNNDHLYLTWEFMPVKTQENTEKGKKWSLDTNFAKMVDQIEGKPDEEKKDDEESSKEKKENKTEIEKHGAEQSGEEKKEEKEGVGAGGEENKENSEAVENKDQIEQENEKEQETSRLKDELKGVIVNDFMDFLENFKGSSTKAYFEGKRKMLEFLGIFDMHIPYVLIKAFNSELAIRIQDNYSWIHESLRMSVATYLVDHKFHEAVHVDEKNIIENVKLHIDSPDFPSSKSKQTFQEFVAQNKMLEEYFFADEILESTSRAGRNMANGYIRHILDKFDTGYCWGGEWDESNLEVKNNGTEFVINKPAEERLSRPLAILDLEKFIKCVLKNPFQGKKKGLLVYFDDFQYDVQQMPDPIVEKAKWKRFVKFMRCHYAFKHPLVRCALFTNLFRMARSTNLGSGPPITRPLNLRTKLTDWRISIREADYLMRVYVHRNKIRLGAGGIRWKNCYLSLLEYLRHCVEHILDYTRENNIQMVKDIAIVDLIIAQELERFVAHLFRFLVYDDITDWMSSAPWRHFEESECIDRPLVDEEIRYDEVSKLYEELCNTISQEEETLSESPEEKKLIEEKIAWAHAEVGVLSSSSSSSIVLISDVSFDEMAKALSANGTEVTVLGENYLLCGQHDISVYKTEDAKDTGWPGSLIVEGPICNDYTMILELISTLSSTQV